MNEESWISFANGRPETLVISESAAVPTYIEDAGRVREITLTCWHWGSMPLAIKKQIDHSFVNETGVGGIFITHQPFGGTMETQITVTPIDEPVAPVDETIEEEEEEEEFTCVQCEDPVEEEGSLCNNCADQYTFCINHTAAVVEIESRNQTNGGNYLCQHCKDSGDYDWCRICQEWSNSQGEGYWDSGGEQFYCQSCFEEYFRYCSGCEEHVHRDDWDDNRSMCNECARNNHRNEDTTKYQHQILHPLTIRADSLGGWTHEVYVTNIWKKVLGEFSVTLPIFCRYSFTENVSDNTYSGIYYMVAHPNSIDRPWSPWYMNGNTRCDNDRFYRPTNLQRLDWIEIKNKFDQNLGWVNQTLQLVFFSFHPFIIDTTCDSLKETLEDSLRIALEILTKKKPPEEQEKITKYISELINTQHINEVKEKYDEAISTASESLRQLTYSRKQVIKLGNTLVGLQRTKSDTGMWEDVSILNQIPSVTSWELSMDSCTFTTKHIIFVDRDAEEYDFGRFKVTMNHGRNEVVFENLDILVDGYKKGMHHPHVFSGGNACFGNVSETVADLLGEMKYGQLAVVLLNFLKSVNYTDPAGELYYHWPKVTE